MDEKIRRKNMFLPDKIARKAFCVSGLFDPIGFLDIPESGIFDNPHLILRLFRYFLEISFLENVNYELQFYFRSNPMHAIF